MQFNFINEKLNKKNFKQIFTRLKRSFVVKLIILGFIILTISSTAIFYLESKYIIYKDEKGISVEDSDNSSNIRTFNDSVWWAIVTSTTVGYGDYFPKSKAGRLVGILLMFFGISFVGVITGNIASFLVEKPTGTVILS